jgi:hypothetical protein
MDELSLLRRYDATCGGAGNVNLAGHRMSWRRQELYKSTCGKKVLLMTCCETGAELSRIVN